MALNTFIRAVTAFFLILVSCQSGAMSILRSADTLVMYGKVVPEDLTAFSQELSNAEVHTIILTNSPGGDLKAAYGIAKLIADSHINTAVKGHCASSCAVIFMAGSTRQMIAGESLADTRLGFHGSHKKESKAVSVKGIPKLREWLMQASGGKFPPELLDKAMYVEKAYDMMLFYYPDENKNSVWFCPEGSKPRPAACQAMHGYDALQAGILTTPSLLDVSTLQTIPEKSKTPTTEEE